MNAMKKLKAVIIAAGAIISFSLSTNAASWWNDDDYYDRWHGGPWYGGGYPGYGYPGYGWGGYRGYGWGGYPGHRQGKTIIVIPQVNATPTDAPAPVPRRPE